METLPTQFTDALSRFEVNSSKAKQVQAAHQEVQNLLVGSELLRAWGVDTILIGSYARSTAIHPANDVDIFSKLVTLDTSVSPKGVFEAVCQMLVDRYGDRARQQARSIKIAFEDHGFSVDVVPAVRSGQRWAIPSRDPEIWEAGEGRWVDTDPERLSKLTVQQNRDPTVGDRGAYVPVVKLVRQTRAYHLGDAKPGAFYFELATYWSFNAGITGDSFGVLFAKTLESISDTLVNSKDSPLIDPVLGTPYFPAPDAADLQQAAYVFSQLADEAARALTLDVCPAAVLWRRILGSNDRGQCFPLPPNCDEKGRTITKVIPIVSRGPNEARPFG